MPESGHNMTEHVAYIMKLIQLLISDCQLISTQQDEFHQKFWCIEPEDFLYFTKMYDKLWKMSCVGHAAHIVCVSNECKF
jgi:hypothetical protein